MKIQICNNIKINIPDSLNDESYINSFEGDFDEMLFSNPEYQPYLKYQIKNLNELKWSFNNLNLQMKYIWIIKCRNQLNKISINFVIETDTNEDGLKIFWIKYMSNGTGRGKNYLYLVKDNEFVQEGCVNKIKVLVSNYLRYPNFFLESI